MSIIHSHRIGIEYLEHCRVAAADDRLSYIRKAGAIEKYWAIPYGNTAVLLLGPGTSLTQPAARLLGSAGVVVGFCGGGGTPVYMGALNEYRPTHYLQAWVRLWNNEETRLEAARLFQLERITRIVAVWKKLEVLEGLEYGAVLQDYANKITQAQTNQALMTAEGTFTKQVYSLMAKHFALATFTRDQQGLDKTNTFLTQGNYLCYGLAASVLWVLGIPHSLPLNHGQTRRGALVFDVADLIKAACILPLAFDASKRKLTESQFRQSCIQLLDKSEALKHLFEAMARAAGFVKQ